MNQMVNIDQQNRPIWSRSRIVEGYVRTTQLQPPEAAILSLLRPAITGKSILDIGVGSGRTTPFLRDLSEDYLGIDYSPEMIKRCRERYPEAQFKQCDARNLSTFPAGRFDFVMFSFNGLDYVEHADRLKVLSEVRRVLKNGGIFVFSSHNRDTKVRRAWDLSHFNGVNPVRSPLRFTKKAILYSWGVANSMKNNRRETYNEVYALLNDECHEYSLLTYYISIPQQIKQVAQFGFETTHIYGLNGAAIDIRKLAAPGDPWIYYVCQARPMS